MMFAKHSLDCLASGFSFLEGPVWLDAEAQLMRRTRFEHGGVLVSDIAQSRLYLWSDGEIDVFREHSRAANGNTLDASGALLTCEHGSRQVTRTDPSGMITVVAKSFCSKKLNSPNDVVVANDGCIFFTDPPYGVEDSERELDFQGLFRSNAAGTELTVIAADFERPNGLAFSPSGEILYVADTARCHIRALRVTADGGVADDSVFCDAERPDGLRVDRAGNLYVAAMNGIEVYDTSGANLARLDMPVRPANLAFGGLEMRSLFICARHNLYRVETEIGVRELHDC